MPTTSNASRTSWAWWILPALSLLAGLPANAQTALEYFDRGVTNYVFRRLPEATLAVRTGLERYPDDPNLTRLGALLREEEKKQQQQQQQQNQDSQEQQDSQPQQEEARQEEKPSEPQPKEDETKEPQQPQPQDAPSSEQQDASKAGEQDPSKPGAEQPAPQPGQADQRGNTNGLASAASPVPLGQMTPEQARQLLEAARLDERAWQLQPPPEARRTPRSIRDW